MRICNVLLNFFVSVYIEQRIEAVVHKYCIMKYTPNTLRSTIPHYKFIASQLEYHSVLLRYVHNSVSMIG